MQHAPNSVAVLLDEDLLPLHARKNARQPTETASNKINQVFIAEPPFEPVPDFRESLGKAVACSPCENLSSIAERRRTDFFAPA
jgi:hypothetical protein